MKYSVGQYIVLNHHADSGQWNDIIGEVEEITGAFFHYYKIYAVTLPVLDGRTYTRERIRDLHSFQEAWVKDKESYLLNCLFERGDL